MTAPRGQLQPEAILLLVTVYVVGWIIAAYISQRFWPDADVAWTFWWPLSAVVLAIGAASLVVWASVFTAWDGIGALARLGRKESR